MFRESAFGVVEISNAGGRDNFSVIVAQNVKEGLRFIPGLMAGRSQIKGAGERYYGPIGVIVFENLFRSSEDQTFTSRSILTAFARRKL